VQIDRAVRLATRHLETCDPVISIVLSNAASIYRALGRCSMQPDA
jgi:hypothetical protein